MKKYFILLLTALLCVTLLLAGCDEGAEPVQTSGETVAGETFAPIIETVDSSETSDLPGTSETLGTSETSEVSETSEDLETSETPETSEMPETSENMETLESFETSDSSETFLEQSTEKSEGKGENESESESDNTPPVVPPEKETVLYFEEGTIELVTPSTTQNADMAVSGAGYDIYQLPESFPWGYRYGCTYLYNADGSVDAYFAAPGTTEEWDWITYRHSRDGGATWSEEKVVLTPTEGSLDHYSVCDPGVVYFGGYYYLGYTSTLNELGMCNNVFVARSKNPDGPFEKWNGSGWGGCKPQPIFYYDESYVKFGYGEPSFVELNGTLYIYYSNLTPSGEYTMVATADATDENWPATVQTHGVAVKKETDSLDVKYVEDWGKFIAIAAGDRFSEDSWLAVYESNDGFSFELVDVVRKDTYAALHNVGISSRRSGRINLSEDASHLRVVYAYGETWGLWNTRVQPITLQLSRYNNMSLELQRDCVKEFTYGELVPDSDRAIAMVRPIHDVYSYTLSTRSFAVRLNVYDTYFEQSSLRKGTAGVTFIVEDPSVCTIDPNTWTATIQGAGTTAVEVHYGDHSCIFYVVVTETKVSGPAELVPVHDTYTIYVGERRYYNPQLRVRLVQADGSLVEYYVSDKNTTEVTFEGYDSSIISIDSRGIVTARSVGETEVTITVDGKSCKIKVIVSDDPGDAFYQYATPPAN